MLDIVFLAIALSMDAFAVAIGLGSRNSSKSLSLKVGLFFGAFQGLMPLLGYLGGRELLYWVMDYANWIAFGLLVLIGAKMIREGWADEEEETTTNTLTYKALLTLSVATSIDAMAAGFSLTLLPINPWLACAIIAITTFGFSWAGVQLGRRSGALLGKRAEIFGGAVLILIGIKILLS